MDPDSDSIYFLFNFFFLLQISWTSLAASIVVLLFLLTASALISGSEVAFFAITPKVYHDLEEENKQSSKLIVNLLKQSQKLLATILIANNFINIGIVILSDYILRNTLPENTFTKLSEKVISFFGESPSISIEGINRGFNFLVTVIGVTFVLVLFGEVMPKVYARVNTLKIARMMASPLSLLTRLFSPISRLLVNWTNKIEEKLEDKALGKGTSSDEINEAIDLMSGNKSTDEDEADLLKKILRFGNVNISQIMKPRMDVVGLDVSLNFEEVLEIIREKGHSRLPVYEENLDSIKGILHVKKFMKYLHEGKDFDWKKEGIVQTEVMFEPETKKIAQLLREFQKERKHMAIVVDEYGGTSGIITLEDILEEILGDIYDEFDKGAEEGFKKVGDSTFDFEGKTFLNDLVKALKLPEDFFDKIKGEADTLAGVVLERFGKLPNKNYAFTYEGVKFKVMEVDARRIKKVQIKLPKKK